MDTDWELRALDEVRRLIARRLSGMNVRVILFGSRARGDARPFSDIDVALDGGEKPVPRAALSLLREDLEESHVPFGIDVVDLFSAEPSLREVVRREGKIWTE